ncbi:MAG: NADPH-dependent FMN reductase [Hyphomicrobiales bacterium]
MMAKILVIPGSTRKGSINDKLAEVLVADLSNLGAIVEKVSLSDYPFPIYNADIEIPQEVIDLAKKFAEVDGLVFVSPEYNASIPPILKNAIDWVSTSGIGDGQGYGPFTDKVCMLGSVSPGDGAGRRGLYHLRAVLMNVGAEIITPQISVGVAGSAFDDDGVLINETARKFADKAVSDLLLSIKRVKAVARS